MTQTLKQITDEQLNAIYEEQISLYKNLYVTKRKMLTYVLGFSSERKEDLSKRDRDRLSEVYQQYLQSTDIVAHRTPQDGEPELSFWVNYIERLDYWTGQVFPMLQELTDQERDPTPDKRLDLETNNIVSILYTAPNFKFKNSRDPNKFNL